MSGGLLSTILKILSNTPYFDSVRFDKNLTGILRWFNVECQLTVVFVYFHNGHDFRVVKESYHSLVVLPNYQTNPKCQALRKALGNRLRASSRVICLTSESRSNVSTVYMEGFQSFNPNEHVTRPFLTHFTFCPPPIMKYFVLIQRIYIINVKCQTFAYIEW
jgi:hypothetical protein